MPRRGASSDSLTGDKMQSDKDDELLNKIDEELHAINARLKKVLARTGELLEETAPEADEPDAENGAESNNGS